MNNDNDFTKYHPHTMERKEIDEILDKLFTTIELNNEMIVNLKNMCLEYKTRLYAENRKDKEYKLLEDKYNRLVEQIQELDVPVKYTI